MIDLSNDEGVRAALREIADWSAVDTAPPVDVLTDAARTHTRVVSLDDRRSRSTARLLGVAAAVVALVAGGLVVLSRRDADPAVGALAGGRWQSMATAPIEPRLAPSSVWTGTELLVWGGVTSSGDSLSDGAAYDPGTDTWRMIAPRPVDAAGSEPKFAAPAPAVFADGRVVTVVHRGEPGIWDWDLLVYDPSGDAWAVADSNRYDQLPTDELVPTEGAAPLHDVRGLAVWLDDVVAVGWRSDLGTIGWAMFDVDTATWGEFHPIDTDIDADLLAPSPFIQGDSLIVAWRGSPVGLGARVIDLPTRQPTTLRSTLTDVHFEGALDVSGLAVGVVSDREGRNTRVAVRLDTSAGGWTEVTAPSRGPVSEEQATLVAVPGGHVLIGGLDVGGEWGGLTGGPVALVAGTDVEGWTSMPRPPFDLERVDPVAVWTGTELIVWGGAAQSPGGPTNLADRPLGDGARYRLPD